MIIRKSIFLLFILLLFSFYFIQFIFINDVNAGTILNLSYSEVTYNSVKLSWSQSADWLGFQYYQICMRIKGTTSWKVVQTINDKNTLTHTVSGLSQLTTYEFKIIDRDFVGPADSNIIEVKTLIDPTYMIVIAIIIFLTAILIIYYRKRLVVIISGYLKEREAKKIRICPQCNKKLQIEKTICPHCGFDVTKSIRCKYCNALYDSSLLKCPGCGAIKE